MEPRPLADYQCNTGEGPLWHPGHLAVYWTDIPAGKLFRLDWPSGAHRQVYSGQPVGGMTLQADGSLALFKAKGAIEIWTEDSSRVVVEAIAGEENSRFNDVIADPAGRVFAGTMASGSKLGTLYRIDPDLTITPVVTEVGCSNGMGFSGNKKLMYYVDSTYQLISVFDYDETTGAIENRRDFVNKPDVPGVPDGMTVDQEDHVWVGFWDGSCAVRYDPDGREVLRVPFPARKVSCITFGGPHYEDMFATTAGGDQKDANGELAGNLFHWIPGVKGRPEFVSRLGL